VIFFPPLAVVKTPVSGSASELAAKLSC